jgi:indolepyruvate ferredoxin oxidoreductase, alpha subunit
LAITKALFENGVAYVGGYQGAPISHLMDVLADAEELLGELASGLRPMPMRQRRPRCWPRPSITRCAGRLHSRDRSGSMSPRMLWPTLPRPALPAALSSSSARITAKAPASCRNAATPFAMKSQFWLLDPRPNLPCDHQGGEGWVRAVRGIEHPRHADGPHPILSCDGLSSLTRDNQRPDADGARTPCPTRAATLPVSSAADVLCP